VFLHENIQHITILIDSAPKIMTLTTDRNKSLIHVPCITRSGLPTPNLLGDVLTEFEATLLYSFIRHSNATRGE